MAPSRASTFYLHLSVLSLPQWLLSFCISIDYLVPDALQTCKTLKFPSGSFQTLLLCAGRALLVVLPVCMLVLVCAEEDVELPGLFSPLLLHGCIPASPLLLQLRPGRSPITLISAAVQ